MIVLTLNAQLETHLHDTFHSDCVFLSISDDHKVLIEPACGAALAALYCGKIKKLQDEGKLGEMKRIVVIVCGGASVNMDLMYKWKKDLGM